MSRLRLPQQTLVRHVAVAVVVGVVLYVISLALSPFNDGEVLAKGAYYFIAIAGLTVLTGLNGQISLGHGALMAVGAYTTALLIAKQSFPLWAALLCSVPVSALAGAVVGAAATRLRGPYLAGATLAFAVGLPTLANKYTDFLGGENGISVPLTQTERQQAWIACLAALIVAVLLANLASGRWGRTFRAVRDDEVAAELAGLRVARVQTVAFVVSSACAGLAGGLLVMVSTLVAPGAFALALSLSLLTAVVLGGLGSLVGAVWGALLLVFLPRWSSDLADTFSLSTNVQNNLPLAVYGLVLIVAMIAAPGGIQGGVRRVGAWLSGRLSGRSREERAEVGANG